MYKSERFSNQHRPTPAGTARVVLLTLWSERRGGARERANKAGTWRLTWIFNVPISPAWNRPIESQHRTFVQAESIAWSCRCRSSRVSQLAELFAASLYRCTHGDFTQYFFFHMNIFLFSTQHTQRDLHHEERWFSANDFNGPMGRRRDFVIDSHCTCTFLWFSFTNSSYYPVDEVKFNYFYRSHFLAAGLVYVVPTEKCQIWETRIR